MALHILITGGGGQLGRELQDALETGRTQIGAIPAVYQDAHVLVPGHAELDVSNKEAVDAFLADRPVDIVFNCAGTTDVDACETDMELARNGNAVGPQLLALALKENAKLVHVSTDYVFSGDAEMPYTEQDMPAPRTVYGRSKLEGELFVSNFCQRHFIVRTSWLYGRWGRNFVKTILNAAKQRGQLDVVDDQRGTPTNANDLAHVLLLLAASDEYGLYHCSGNGSCTWYDFARAIVEGAGIPCEVRPCTTEQFPRPAPRPAYSVLDNKRLRETIGDCMRPWREALDAYLQEMCKILH